MRVLVDTDLNKILREEGITDVYLCQLATEVKNGNHDGELIRNLLFKKRVNSHAKGASNGPRSIVAHKAGGNMFFIDFYLKNDPPKKNKKERKYKEEIPPPRMKIYKELARSLLAQDDAGIKITIDNGEFREVNCNG